MPSRSSKRFLVTVLGGVWILTLVGIVIALFWPVLGQRYREQEGSHCSDNLERIFEAKQILARELNLDPSRPYPPVVQQLEIKDIAPYLPTDRLDLSCPSGGKYMIRPLVDEKGEVVPPTCDYATKDPDGDGNDEASEGFHIHLRSCLQDSNSGLYYRDPELSFPGGPVAGTR
jgi:hypothetical protein